MRALFTNVDEYNQSIEKRKKIKIKNRKENKSNNSQINNLQKHNNNQIFGDLWLVDSPGLFQYQGVKKKEYHRKRLNSTDSTQQKTRAGTSNDQGSNDSDRLSARFT
jgi:hypothetical protein